MGNVTVFIAIGWWKAKGQLAPIASLEDAACRVGSLPLHTIPLSMAHVLHILQRRSYQLHFIVQDQLCLPALGLSFPTWMCVCVFSDAQGQRMGTEGHSPICGSSCTPGAPSGSATKKRQWQ